MDRFVALSTFARVVEAGSFAHAAERLGVSVSAVSRHVADLEAHLGVRLLNRTTRRLSLTESGRAFHERAVQLLADLEEAAAEVGEAVEPRGTLRLTCGVTFGVRHLVDVVTDFHARHPDVRFDVELSDRIVDLVDEGIDLAIRIGAVRGGSLIARPIGSTTLVCCASPDYLARHPPPASPADLLTHACLTYAYAPERNIWRFRDAAGREHAVTVSGPVHANNAEILNGLAARGMGVLMEPDFVVAPYVRAGTLVTLLDGYAAAAIPIHAVYPSRRHLSAKVRTFVDFVAARFTAPAPWSLGLRDRVARAP
jgi:DNA-binding transcriptional LysR family regulator